MSALAGRQGRRSRYTSIGIGLILVTLAVIGLACSDDPSGPGGPVVSVTITPSLANLVSLGETVQLTAVARDAIGQSLSGATINWSTSDNRTATVTDGLVRAVANGQVMITATVDSISGQALVDIEQAAAQIVFAVQPGNGWVADTLASDARVEILDALGSAVVGADDSIRVSLGSNPSSGVLQGQTSRAAEDGVATFPGLSVDRAGAGYTMLADYGTLDGESDSFNVTTPSVWVGSFAAESVTVIDPATNTVAGRIGTGPQPSGLGITADGLHVYLANRGNGSVSSVETTSSTIGPPIALGAAMGQLLTVSPDGGRVYVSDSALDSVHVIDTSSDSRIDAVPTQAFPLGIGVTPDGAFAYVAHLNSDSVTVFETATNQVVANIGVGGGQIDALAYQNGVAVYVTRTDGTLMVISTATNTVVDSVPLGGAGPQLMGSYVGGRDIFVATATALVIVDTQTNTVSRTIPVAGTPVDVAISADGTLAYVSCSGDGTVKVIVLATGFSTPIAVGASPATIDIMPAPLP